MFARAELLGEVASARSLVRLASPFLTVPIAAELATAANTAAKRQLLTALVAGSVQVGALDPEALRLLQGADWEVRSIRNLHAKVSLVDSSWGLVGSGNLTNAGLGSNEKGNIELGVILSPAQIESAASIYDSWWSEAEAVSAAEIERFAALPKFPSGQGPEDGVGPALEIADPSAIEEVVGDGDPGRRYWVKANYYRRNTDGRGWWHRGWISDWRRASYRIGDLILLYLGAEFDGPRSCPAVVRVVGESRHDPEFVVRNGDPEAKDRWPYVTDIECVFEVPISQGVPLGVFDVSASGLQGGYKELSRAQFEAAVHHMLGASGNG
jgi:hypothetical protein